MVKSGNMNRMQIKIFSLLHAQQYGMPFYFDFARYSYLVMARPRIMRDSGAQTLFLGPRNNLL